MRTSRTLLVGAAILLGTACAEKATGVIDASALLDAFSTTPLAYESASSSFAGTGSSFMPPGRSEHRGGGPGHDFMGGGLGMDFLGGELGGPRPFDRGGLSGSCTYSATTGVNSCTATNNGITVTRTVAFKTAAGTAQATRDSLTNTIVEHATVTGTQSRRDSIKTTVNHTSDRTVTGLAYNSTQRTVNGTSSGSESSAGINRDGAAFTSSRVAADTTRGVVVPVASGAPSYPTAGTVIRVMNASLTIAGTTSSKSRREVITYDGTAIARLTITTDGVTQSCTVALPRGRPSC